MLSEAEIIDLWNGDDVFKDIAAAEIVRDIPRYANLFFRLVQQDPGRLSQLAINEIPFLQNPYLALDVDSEGNEPQLFGEWAAAERLFFNQLDEYIKANPQERRVLVEALEENFLSARKLLQTRYPDVSVTIPEEANRQLTLFVTGKCNLHCPYCFASDMERQEVSLENLRRVFGWASRQGISVITPCGGEPLIYSHFQEFLSLLRHYGMTSYFATNFTVDIERFDGFDTDIIRTLYLHLTPELFTNGELMKRFIRNVDVAKERRMEIVCRVNITPESHDVSQWIGFVSSLGVHRLNVSLTIPSERSTNLFISPHSFHSYIPIVEELLSQAEAAGIVIGFSKPIPLCQFPERLHSKLVKHSFHTVRCNIAEEKCMRNLSLSSSLLFSPCLGLNGLKIPFSDSLTWNSIEEIFFPYVSGLLRQPLFPFCDTCYLWRKNLCQGSCLSYKEKDSTV